jgi:imidazolonepropionase-like amidohydrolase
VLAAATPRAAAEAGLAPLGTLKPGATADVIVVRGDARRLAPSLASPRLVVSSGVVRSH